MRSIEIRSSSQQPRELIGGKALVDNIVRVPSTHPLLSSLDLPEYGIKKPVSLDEISSASERLTAAGIRMQRLPGGGAFNFAGHLNELAGEANLATTIVDDEAGKIIKERLREQGITFSPGKAEATAQAIVFIEQTPDGRILDKRSLVYDPEEAEIDIDALRNPSLRTVFLGPMAGPTYTEETHKALSILDVNQTIKVGGQMGTGSIKQALENPDAAQAMRRFMGRANLLVQNETEGKRMIAAYEGRKTESMHPAEIAFRLHHLANREGRRDRITAITNGGDGAYAVMGEGKEAEGIHSEVLRVQIKNTNGAGDASTSALSHETLTRRNGIHESLATAALFGALATEQIGSDTGGVPREQVPLVLEERGGDVFLSQVTVQHGEPRFTRITSLAKVAAHMRRT